MISSSGETAVLDLTLSLAFTSLQTSLSPSLPKLEDDARSHKDDDDGYGNCHVKLRVHT